MDCCTNNINRPSADCVASLLKKIDVLQKKATYIGDCTNDFLSNSSVFQCNTRPIVLYNDQNLPWHFPINNTDSDGTEEDVPTSCVLRVENIENGCVTCRVLVEIHNDDDVSYLATKSFVCIKLSCICACRCLIDCYIDLC